MHQAGEEMMARCLVLSLSCLALLHSSAAAIARYEATQLKMMAGFLVLSLSCLALRHSSAAGELLLLAK
jgi:hypothetical protein